VTSLDERRDGRTRTILIAEAVKSFLDAENPDNIRVHNLMLPRDIALELLAYRYATDEPRVDAVVASALRDYIANQRHENPGIDRKYDDELVKLRRVPGRVTEIKGIRS
jgi:hypothetical protein